MMKTITINTAELTLRTKWHFELHDGKGGIIIMPKPATEQEVIEVCRHRFGEDRLKEVTA